MPLFKTFAVLAFISFFAIGSAQAEQTAVSDMPAGLYSLDPTHASLHFKVSHVGLSHYTARFDKFDSLIQLDPNDVTKSKVKATIDVTSLNTGYPHPEEKDFDKKLTEGTEWFNTNQFPEMTFISRTIEKTGDMTAKITGDLTFLGVTKPVVLDATLNAAMGNHPFMNKPALGISATGFLKRSDFGMNTYIPNIGDEVAFIIEAEYIFGHNDDDKADEDK